MEITRTRSGYWAMWTTVYGIVCDEFGVAKNIIARRGGQFLAVVQPKDIIIEIREGNIFVNRVIQFKSEGLDMFPIGTFKDGVWLTKPSEKIKQTISELQDEIRRHEVTIGVRSLNNGFEGLKKLTA